MSHIESGHLPEMNTHVFRHMSNDDALRRCNADLFIDEGFGILPLCPNGKEPLAGSHGVKDAFAEKETVAAVFADGSGLNFGVVPPADMFALDMDIRNGGEASMRALLDAIGPLPTTVTVSTGGGGTHQYFRLPGDVTASQLPGKMRGYSGIDVMTMKRYLVGPGSIHPNGTAYAFADGLGIGEVPIATAPAALIDLLIRPTTVGSDMVSCDREKRSANSGPPANFAGIRVGCKWARHCEENAKSVSEPEWTSLAMILAHCTEGQGTFHAISKLDPVRYDYRMTEAKFEHAVRSDYRPPRCTTIHHDHGFEGCTNCAFFGTIGGPISLGYEDAKVVELQKSFVYASGAERYFDVSANPFAKLTPKGFSDHFGHLGLKAAAHAVMVASKRTVKVNDIGYFPGNDALIVEREGHRYLNSYRNTGCKAEPGSCAGILAHLAYLVPAEAELKHMLDCFAFLVQHPGEKIRHGWVIIGAQGTGKRVFTDVSKLLFGDKNVAEVPARDLNGRFQGQLVDKQVLILGELMIGDRRNTYNENKELFSEDKIQVEEKYSSPRMAKTPDLIIGTSNHDRPIYIDPFDRRFFVVKSPAAPKSDDYYKTFYNVTLPTEVSAFKEMLLKRDISSFSPGARPPKTVAKDQIAFESMSMLAQRLADDIACRAGLFAWDLASIRDLALRYSRPLGRDVSEGDVRSALIDLGAQRFNNGEPVLLDGGKKKRLWVVRDFDKWQDASLADARHHLAEGGGLTSH